MQKYNKKIDVCFLDVLLSEKNSLNWLTENSLNQKPEIIAITAFPQAVYNLSKTDACYLLLKSHIDDAALSCALQKALHNISAKRNVVIVNIGHKYTSICADEIVFIESFNNNILLHLVDGELNLYSTMKDFTQKLPLNFLQCHKSYVININYVTGFRRNNFTMKNGMYIPIPPKRYKEITQKYIELTKTI